MGNETKVARRIKLVLTNDVQRMIKIHLKKIKAIHTPIKKHMSLGYRWYVTGI